MSAPGYVWVSTDEGSAFIHPDSVVAITDSPNRRPVILLRGGFRLKTHEERTARELAEDLLGPDLNPA